jgi:hypothetical protein
MSTDQGNQGTNQPSVIQPNRWSTIIIICSLVAVLVVVIVSIIVLRVATDVTSVLGVVLPTVSAIAGAAFGVTVGTQSGAGQATAAAAKQQVARVQYQARLQIQKLSEAFSSVHDEIRRFPYREQKFIISPADMQSRNETYAVPEDKLTDIQARIETIRSLLETLPS